MRLPGIHPTLCLLLSLVAVISGCAGPMLTKRYASMENVNLKPETIEAKLTAFSTGVPSISAKTTLLYLSGRGQASFIRVLGRKSGKTDEFLQSLGTPIRKQKTFQRILDHTTIKRRVVFSIDHWPITNPADRIRRAKIRLDNLTGRAEFRSWTRFATKYETVNLGNMTFTEQSGTSLGITGGPLGGLVGAAANAQRSQAFREAIPLTRRFVSVTGTLLPERAELIQEGVPGIDLTGNLIVDLTLRIGEPSNHYDTLSFHHLFDADGQPNKPDHITVSRQTHFFVVKPSNVYADAILTATVRRVKKGGSTIFEGDDDVVFATGRSTVQHLLLVPMRMLRFSVWSLTDPKGTPLAISSGSSFPETIFFSTYDDAVTFRNYLVQTKKPSFVRNRHLWLNDKPLHSSVAKQLQVEIEKLNW